MDSFMRTLFLASNGSAVIKYAEEALGADLKTLKIVYIITASKKVDDLKYLKDHKKNMNDLGWNYEEEDLDGKSQEKVKKILVGADAVYVEGGNAFHLLKSIRQSGFDRVIGEELDRGLIYIGTSAGSYVATPTIAPALWKTKDKDLCGVTDFSGMGLVPFAIFAHYLPKYRQNLEKEIPLVNCPVKALVDDQAYLIRGNEVNFIGKGPEVTF